MSVVGDYIYSLSFLTNQVLYIDGLYMKYLSIKKIKMINSRKFMYKFDIVKPLLIDKIKIYLITKFYIYVCVCI